MSNTYIRFVIMLSICGLLSSCTGVQSHEPINSDPRMPQKGASITGSPYTSPYRDIPINGPILTPEEKIIADTVAKYDHILKLLAEKQSTNFGALNSVAAPGWASFLTQVLHEQLQEGITSTGSETVKLREIQITNGSALVLACSDDSTQKMTGGQPLAQSNSVGLRAVELYLVKGRWLVTSNGAMREIFAIDSPPEADNDALRECRAYFGKT
jgi:hypothetical protein